MSIRFQPSSEIIEDDVNDVTLHCDVIDGKPLKLLEVKWMKNEIEINQLTNCDGEKIFNCNFIINFLFFISLKVQKSNDDDENENDYSYSDENDDKNNDNTCSIDIAKLILKSANREFMGNYSCRGLNAAGWSEDSKSKFLEIFYKPGKAKISVHPTIPIKRKAMILSCSVEDYGNPKASRFQWMRGGENVRDIVTAEWTIDPVTLQSRNNFSCFAFNDGGKGESSTIQVDVQAPPTFISKLHPKTEFYSEPNVSLSCRVECVPQCSISWFRDDQEISSSEKRYFIKETLMPANMNYGDFDSVLSELVILDFKIMSER